MSSMATSVPSSDVRLAVLVSGSGTNLQALLDAIDADADFRGQVVLVGADRADAGGLERARDAGIDTFAEALEDHPDRKAWESALTAKVQAADPQIIVLAGFMKILSGDFLRHWPDRVVNTHPSLLPAFRGAHAVRDALVYGVKVTGSTVHLVDEQVDHGPILAQRAVDIVPGESEDDLHERIKTVEHELFPAIIRRLCHGDVSITGRTAE